MDHLVQHTPPTRSGHLFGVEHLPYGAPRFSAPCRALHYSENLMSSIRVPLPYRLDFSARIA